MTEETQGINWKLLAIAGGLIFAATAGFAYWQLSHPCPCHGEKGLLDVASASAAQAAESVKQAHRDIAAEHAALAIEDVEEIQSDGD